MEYYIPISRRLFEHSFWCEERIFSRFEAWLDIVRSARFEETKQLVGNRFIEVQRGQILVSLRFLAKRWKWSTKKVCSFLDLLIQDKMITKETLKETVQTVLTICNYDKYNTVNQSKETRKKQKGNTLGKKEGKKKKQERNSKETPKETHENNITHCNSGVCELDNSEEKTEKKQQGNEKETIKKQQGNSRVDKINKDNKEEESINKESPNGDEKEGKPSSHTQNSDFLKFNEWVKRKAPYCSDHKNFPSQITENELLKLKEKYTGKQIADTIEQIENRKDLRKRYTNLYRTVLNWAKKEYDN